MKVRAARTDEAGQICDLVNSAYRGESSRFGWTTEADYLEGARVTPERTKEMIQPEFGQTVLVMRESEDEKSAIVGCVYLERTEIAGEPGCYLGMLTVEPKMQDRGLGRILLEEAEIFAREWGALRMILGVIQLRGTLMAWYERRGYKRTEITKPFPYDQPEVGIPKRKDLHFVMFEKDLC
jgi:GNAT superfamily N-acetyltransferase